MAEEIITSTNSHIRPPQKTYTVISGAKCIFQRMTLIAPSSGNLYVNIHCYLLLSLTSCYSFICFLISSIWSRRLAASSKFNSAAAVFIFFLILRTSCSNSF